MDKDATKYSTVLRVQPPLMEDIQDLKAMAKELILRFYQTNRGVKPTRIVFYRDGVSEGQFLHVFHQEVRAIRAACFELDASYAPPITFVVVQKRHHTRFFPTPGSATDRSGNVAPGCVVDTTVVHPREFDFYLQSHAGIQGTSRLFCLF